MAKMKDNDVNFEIYSIEENGQRGLIQVSEKLHQDILHMLSKGPLSTTEISESTHKAQSTLSVHLDQMVSQKLIRSEYDKNDSRRKIFEITSVKVAGAKDGDTVGICEANQVLVSALKDPKFFYRDLFRAVVMSAESNGMDVCPMMERFGSTLAEKMSQNIGSAKVEDVLREIQEFYEKNDLGEVCIYTFLPLTIIIHDSEETQFKFEGFASFHHGFFKTMLSHTIGRKYDITMNEIFGTGNNYYKFIIELAK